MDDIKKLAEYGRISVEYFPKKHKYVIEYHIRNPQSNFYEQRYIAEGSSIDKALVDLKRKGVNWEVKGGEKNE